MSFSSLSLFLGRFHPLFVHLPIGFIVLLVIVEGVIWKKRNPELIKVRPWLILLSLISSVFSFATGYLLSLGGGYEVTTLENHKWAGFILTFLLLIYFIISLKSNSYQKKIQPVAAFSILITLFITGHKGGNLTHGENYLTSALEGIEAEKPIIITDINKAVVYKDIIHPILKEKCTSCHNEKKKKGDLLLTSYSHIMKGGEHGKVIEAGMASKSELYRLITMSPEEKEAMPPKGKEPINKTEIALIKWWIDNGADEAKTVAQYKRDAEIDKILASLEAKESENILADVAVDKVSENDIAEATKRGFIVVPVADDQNFLQVKLNNDKDSLHSEDIESLRKLAGNIIWLDLKNSKFSDHNAQILSEMKYLNRLHLENTLITDACLKNIKNNTFLEYVNLYGTNISDTGISEMKDLKNLKKLFLWKSKVTDKGINSLTSHLPTTKIFCPREDILKQRDSLLKQP